MLPHPSVLSCCPIHESHSLCSVLVAFLSCLPCLVRFRFVDYYLSLPPVLYPARDLAREGGGGEGGRGGGREGGRKSMGVNTSGVSGRHWSESLERESGQVGRAWGLQSG